MMVKLAYGAIGWRRPMSETARVLKTLGYSGLEGYGLLELLSADRNLAAELPKFELEFVGSYFAGSFIQADRQAYELKRFADTCKSIRALNGHKIVVGGGKRTEPIRPEHWSQFMSTINLMDQIARDEGVDFCFHPHYGTLVFYRHEIDRFIQEAPTSVRLTLDTGHIGMADGTCGDFFDRFWDRIGHVHLKDYSKSAGEFCSLGAGDLKFEIQSVIKLLQEREYSDWVTVELDASSDPESCARQSKEFVDHAVAELSR